MEIFGKWTKVDVQKLHLYLPFSLLTLNATWQSRTTLHFRIASSHMQRRASKCNLPVTNLDTTTESHPCTIRSHTSSAFSLRQIVVSWQVPSTNTTRTLSRTPVEIGGKAAVQAHAQAGVGILILRILHLCFSFPKGLILLQLTHLAQWPRVR
jgi:hypothetical protein